MIIIKEPYYDLLPKMPYSQQKRYYERIVKRMKHRKRKRK